MTDLDDAEVQPMKCGVCSGALVLAEPKYVHADGRTYRHPIRPVPADGPPPAPRPDPAPDPRDNAALNAIAQVLTDRFGWLPLDVRYGAAREALKRARQGYALHDDLKVDPS